MAAGLGARVRGAWRTTPGGECGSVVDGLHLGSRLSAGQVGTA